MHKRLSAITFIFATVILSCLSAAPVFADIRGFDSTVGNLQQGMVVRQGQSERGALQLEPASQKNGTHVVGITTAAPQDPETSAKGDGIVFVEAQGEVVALVNGEIAAGDVLTLSATPGILTKLNDQANGVVLATALEATNPARLQTVQLQAGAVTVNSIKVRFGQPGTTPTDPATTSLRQFGDGILNEDITPLRLTMAALLSVATVITASVIMHGAISNAFYAISRNPLTKRTILLTMYKILAIAAVLLALGLGGAYLILKH